MKRKSCWSDVSQNLIENDISGPEDCKKCPFCTIVGWNFLCIHDDVGSRRLATGEPGGVGKPDIKPPDFCPFRSGENDIKEAHSHEFQPLPMAG